MTDKLSIIKQTVNAPARKLTAKWSLDIETRPAIPLKDVKDMTIDEEADEIVRRLSQPYKTLTERLEDSLSAAMSEEISREIDNEILIELMRITNDKESNT